MRKISLFFSLVCVFAVVLSLLPADAASYVPFFEQVVLVRGEIAQRIPVIFGGVLGDYTVAVLFGSYALFFFLTRRAAAFWWMAPYSALIIYTVYLLMQVLAGKDEPAFLLSRLSQAPTMGAILIILSLLLEITIALLLLILSVRLRRRYLQNRKVQNTKVSDVRQKKVARKDAAKAKREAYRQKRAALKQQKRKPRKERKQDTPPEPVFTDTPEPETEIESVDEKDTPLAFPAIREMPQLRTINTETLDDQKLYVGSVKMRDDESLLVSDTPIDDADEAEEVPVERTYDPIPSLRKQFEQDALVPEFEIEQAPVRPRKVKIEEPAPAEVTPVQAVPIVKEEPKVTESTAPVEEDIPEEEDTDDMDTVSGVGGLVSSNAGSSALLTRNKTRYNWPPEDLLDTYPDHATEIDEVTRLAGENLINTLKQFKIEAELMNIVKGPTVTMFEVSPAPGVRVSSIISLSDNIALQLAARQVRIVAPIPGKQAVGIEVPNHDRSIIGFKDLLPTIDAKTYQVPMILGRKITGEPVVIELTQTPHLLIAGATGSGKSVCVNSLISSLLYRRSPKDVRLILVDPKIVELRVYNGIPHLLTPVITEPKKTIKALEFCLYEMDRRYKLLNALAVRNIAAYNRKIQEMHLARERLPFIVVVIDEFADLMTTVGKELETLLARLAAMARAVGIHLVLATQRPSANVITGIIKSNIPTRIAFMVASQIDSRIIIDETGAEKLLGRGDMLFAPGWDPHSVRIQGAFLSDEEVERIVAFAKTQGEPDYLDEAFFEDDTSSSQGDDDESDDSSDDALMEKALRIVVERQSASASYLQRRLKIGYNRAARLVEQMEDDGYVGPARGSKPRELLRYPE